MHPNRMHKKCHCQDVILRLRTSTKGESLALWMHGSNKHRIFVQKLVFVSSQFVSPVFAPAQIIILILFVVFLNLNSGSFKCEELASLVRLAQFISNEFLTRIKSHFSLYS